MRYFISLILLPIRLLILFYYLIRDSITQGNHVFLSIPSSFNDSHKSFLMRKFQSGTENPFFIEFLEDLTSIRKDNRVKYLSLVIPKIELGFSEIQTIYRELERMKEAGVHISAFSEEGDIKSLFLLSLCDKRYSCETAEFTSILPSIESMFFGEVARKWKVKVEVFQSGPYKSFGEAFTRKEFSNEARSNLSTLISDLKQEIISKISTNSKLPQSILQKPILTSALLKDLQFFHNTIELDEFCKLYLNTNLDELSKKIDNDWEKLIASKKYKPNTKELSLNSITIRKKLKKFQFLIPKKSIIAILPLNGEISEGSSSDTELKSGAIERHSVIKNLKEIKENKNIKALILLIDSPGGSAIDSEKIYQALKSFDKKIPVYSYISNTCASGGYYLACSSRRIYSNSIGIVGSIGTIMMRFDLEGLYNKFGISKDKIGFYPQREIFSDSGKLTKESQTFLKNEIQRVEGLFLRRVEEARKVGSSTLQKMGGGRVFSPKRFIETNLIDQNLSLIECIESIQNELAIQIPKIEFIAPNYNFKLAIRKSLPFLRAVLSSDYKKLINNLLPQMNIKHTNGIYFINPIANRLQNLIK